jgi:hypothetical protein
MDGSKRRLTKQAVVKRLSREIASLQARGYTIEQIVESLHGVGFDITTPTLKSCLQRKKKRKNPAAAKATTAGPAGRGDEPRAARSASRRERVEGSGSDGAEGRGGGEADGHVLRAAVACELAERPAGQALRRGRRAQASTPEITVPTLTSLEISAGATPTEASIVCPKAARLRSALTSPLVEAAPVLESMGNAP